MSVVALAGGVGGARFLRGLVRVLAPEDIMVLGNTGDDDTFFGLHVSPDLDTVTYTLAGVVGAAGWGVAGDTFRALDALAHLGEPTWFRLGDADLAAHLYRTERLRAGATLSEVTAEITLAFGLKSRLVPMSDDRVATRIETDGATLAMQEWFVRERAVAVSPIIHGAPVRGPADRLMAAVGLDVSCVGVASAYADICGSLLIDTSDATLMRAVEAQGVRAVIAPILMRDAEGAERLARIALDSL